MFFVRERRRSECSFGAAGDVEVKVVLLWTLVPIKPNVPHYWNRSCVLPCIMHLVGWASLYCFYRAALTFA